MPPVVNHDLCAGCGVCEDCCPLDIIYFDVQKERPEIRYKEECWHCGSCRQECPEGAITIRFPLRIMIPAGVTPY